MREELRRKGKLIKLVIGALLVSLTSFGEGTKEIMPNSGVEYYLLINRSGGLSVPFAAYTPNTGVTYQAGTTPQDYRLNIRVCNAGERIKFGFNRGDDNTYYRIKDPNGNIVVGPTLMPNSAATGYISSHARALAGPASVVGGSGYTDLSYTTTMAGDYYVEFNRGDANTYQNNETYIQYFDISVTNPAGNTIIPGRLWSKAWYLADSDNAFEGNFYIYSDDSIVTRLVPNGMEAHYFSISCNATGCTNTGNANADRISRNGPSLYPQYKIFLNNPDPVCFPTGAFGSIVGSPSVVGCGNNRCINLNVDKGGNIIITLDLNGIPGFQSGTADRQIGATVVPGNNCIPWDGLNGSGVAVIPGFTFTIKVDFLNGITHLPLYDCEDNRNGYIVNLIRPAGPVPKIYWDDSPITAGTATDGLTNLTGCTTPTGCHRWRNRGSNTCPPCSETLNSWWYAKIDSAQVTYINQVVIVDANTTTIGGGFANNSFTACGNNTPKQLNGSVSAPAGVTGQWVGGDGTFSPNNTTMNATYAPGPGDIAAGFVKIILRSVGGTCPQEKDSLLITLSAPPVVFAGVDKTACKNNAVVTIGDATKNAATTGVTWSGGAGSYLPNSTTVNITYTPTAGELTTGFVDLTLTGTGPAVCPNATDVVRITYSNPPTSNAGGNRTVCANNSAVTAIAGTVSAGATPAWTSSSGCAACFSAPGASTTNYNPSATDIANGTVTLTLTASLAGCTNVTSTMTITINPTPTISAGPNQSICKNNNVATLAGSTNATGHTWSSSSGCSACFSSTTSLTPTYTPSATDLTNGSVTLTLTGTQALCTNVTSTMTITYTAAPTASTGPSSLNFCSNNPAIQLAGVVTGATGGIWSGGAGTFISSNTDLNAVYHATPAEVTTGVLALFLTSTGNGNCNPAKDTIILFSVPIVTVNAGANKNVCRNNPVVSLAGTTTGAVASVAWTSPTAGAAAFTSPGSLNTNYTLSAADLAAGSVILTLTATPLEPTCSPQSSTITITVIEPPTVNAGPDQTNVCFNPGTVSLSGFSSTGSGTWSGGAGTFSPNATTANATYNSTVGERGTGVTLTYTSSNNVLCNAVTDQVHISFAPQITVNAGTPITICANNAVATLNGSSPITGAGQWSGGAGVFSPNANTLNATYTPTAAEITAGTVTLTLTATNTGGCIAPTSTVTITISAPPVISINAGAAANNICADNPTATLTVSLPGSLGVIWSGGAGTYSPNNTTANITYTATAAEIVTGTVTLTATSTNNGICNPVTDQINVVIAPRPVVNAGADQVLCGSTASVNLSGTVTGATGGTWTTSGTGTFNNANLLTATYTPSAADKASGLVTLTLTSTGMAPCNAVNDQMIITFTVVPTINAGPDITACMNTLPVQLNGSGSPATWSAPSGTFSNTASMTSTYTPTGTGTFTLTLTTNASGACPQVSDQVNVTINPSPTANAGTDITACGNLTSINIAGTITLASSGFWTTSGSGTIGDPTTLSTTYTPSAADRAAGSVTLTLTTVGNGFCNQATDDVVISISAPVTVSAGGDRTLCINSTNIPLTGVVTGATGGTWTMSGGAGTITNATSATGATYTPAPADVTVTFTLTTTGNPPGCGAMTDDVAITFSPIPVVTVGANQTVCNDVASVALTGTVTNATGGSWTTTGAGTFTPNNTTINTSYVPAANESGTFTFTLASTGNGVCNGVSTSMTVTILPRPTVNAGIDRSVCANNPAITVTGTVTNAPGGTWTTLGTGSFSGVAGLSATYTPSATDIANGSVSLRFTTTGMAPCMAVSDIMVVTITPAPTVNAGPDRIVCANNRNVSLLGTTTIVTSGTWTTLGSGAFSGVSANGLTATYTPSLADTTAHSVRLVLTSTNNGLCNAVTDTLLVTITPAPIVNAGPDQVICADSFYVKLDANFINATAGIWTSTGTGAFFNSNATFDTATYVPSPADRAAGSVTLTFTTTVQGSCSPVSDNLVITITTAPTVNAGADQTMCSDGTSINITGTKNAVASGIIWTTSGNGTFGTNTNLSTTYTPSAVDKAGGTITLTITTTGNGTCKPATDQLNLTIIPRPTVNTGLDRTVCADIYSTGISLTPTVTNSPSVSWTTSGSGAFGPSATTANATYFPSVADTIAHSVTLTLTANGNSPCASRNDAVVITINPKPLVDAGVNTEICNGTNASLNGRVVNAGGGTWTTAGTGTFAPNANVLNATYVPSPADTTAGSVVLTLTSTGMGSCNPVSDQVTLTFKKRPIATAGPDATICADAEGYMLFGSVTNATGGIWSTSGTGGFSPSPTNLINLFFMSSQDSINGQVVLTLTTTGNGSCPPATDNITINIDPVPSADAGPPSMNVCSNADSVNLNGTVVNAAGGFWSSLGDGTFSKEDTLNTTYFFGTNDKLNPSVLLTFISQDNGSCLFYTDTIRIFFTPTTNVSAGSDRTICRTDFPITLQGSGTSGVWSGGTASQFGNINSLSTTYTPTAAESASGSLTLTLSAVSTCAGIPDDVTFTFINGPTADITTPLTPICTNVNTITFPGTASSTGVWTTTGSGGSFSDATINATYTLSASDKASGLLRFTFTIPAAGFCNAVRDTASLRIFPTPTISAGPDQTRCANALNPVTMNGAFTIAGGIQWYTINGNNGPLTSPTSVNAVYTPVAADIGASPIRIVIETTASGFCSTQRDTMQISITTAPTASIGMDTTMCADRTPQMSATFTVATGGIWSTTGTGTFSPSNTAQTVSYSPSSADTSAGTVTINYLTTGNGICAAAAASKILTFTPTPIVMAGIDDTVCSGQDTVSLNVVHSANAPGVLWTTTGTGTFIPNNTTLGAQYIPSALDKANGGAIIRLASTGVAECDSVFDFKVLNIIPSPVASVNAGFDQTICRDEIASQLAGFLVIATGAKWDCQGAPCSGTFIPSDQDLFAQYIPSAADTAAGSVILRLTTTTGNGICDPVYDEMVLTIIDFPRVEAGNPITVCADTAGLQLGGTITHATLVPVGYSWVSSGNGVFTPNAFVANPVYIPSSNDRTIGNVSFTLTSTNNGTCQPYSDVVDATLTPQPTIGAGIDKATCSNVPTVSFTGTMAHATTATWTSTGTGTIATTSGDGLSMTYTPSALDDSAGTVSFTITTSAGLGMCKPVTDNVVLTIGPAPIVNAGIDRTICADNQNVAVTGTVTVATGGLWTTLGSGTFASNTNLVNTYRPSAADTVAHMVRLILTSTGNGLCLAEDDTITLSIDPKPVVSAGTAIVCEIQNGSQLNGIVLNAAGGLWSTSGTGVFSVNNATLNAMYYPSAADAAAGMVTLTLISDGNGQCNAVSSTTNLSITRIPIANAGPDQFICQNSTTALNATLDPLADRYEWTRLSGMVVNPDITSINVTADKDTTFVLTVYDVKNCASVKDTVNIRTFVMPVLNLNGTACFTDSNAISVTAVPSFPPVPGTFQWFNNGSIMSGQNTTQLNPTSTGTYTITFSYGGCDATSGPFTLNPSPTLGGIDKTNCVNNTTTLATSNVSGGSSFTYNWTGPNITSTSNGPSITAQYTVAFDTVAYGVTVTNEFTCSTTDSVYLISIGAPIMDLIDDTLCQNETTTLIANVINFGVGSIPPITDFFPTYAWTRDGTNLNNGTNTQAVNTQGQYIVQITIGDCTNNRDTSNILYNNFATFDLPATSRFCSETQGTDTLEVITTTPSGYTYTYLWSTGETTPMIEVNDGGEYYVTVTSSIGTSSCPIADTIDVKNICAPRVFVPNAFTPDGTTNKNFKIYGGHYSADGFSITIFSRWGEVIFSSTNKADMENIGWDGTYKEKPMPMGVYTYIIYYNGEDPEYEGPYRKDGDILILR